MLRYTMKSNEILYENSITLSCIGGFHMAANCCFIGDTCAYEIYFFIGSEETFKEHGKMSTIDYVCMCMHANLVRVIFQ